MPSVAGKPSGCRPGARPIEVCPEVSRDSFLSSNLASKFPLVLPDRNAYKYR